MGALRPFERLDANLTPAGWARLALASVTLVPARALLILAVLLAYWAGLKVLARTGASAAQVRAVTRPVARVVMVLCGFWHVEQVNEPGWDELRDGPVVVVANHVSYMEILFLLSTRLCPSFLMKATCLKVPIVGDVAVKMGALLVDRERNGGKGAAEALTERVRELEARRKAQPLLVFPEGTTTNGRFLLRFRTGAFLAGAAVRPVVVEFPLAKGGFSVAYESVSTPVHLLRMLAQWRHEMRVTYLPVYEPSAEEKASPALFASNVRATMARASGLALCDQSYEDKLEYHGFLRDHFARLGPLSLYKYVRPDLVTAERPRGNGARSGGSGKSGSKQA